MFGTFFRFVAAVILVGIIGAVGISVYQAGFVAGAAADGAAVIAPWAGYGWGFGPGLGFLGSLLLLFLVFGLIRAAFGGHHGRRSGWGHWASRHPWDPEHFQGTPWESRAREVHDAWHRGTTPWSATGTDREPAGPTTGAAGGV